MLHCQDSSVFKSLPHQNGETLKSRLNIGGKLVQLLQLDSLHLPPGSTKMHASNASGLAEVEEENAYVRERCGEKSGAKKAERDRRDRKKKQSKC